jgi:hypothetical protein
MLSALHACACGSTSEGNVEFTGWGEEYIEAGIPAKEFEDGYSVRYDQFLVVLSHVHVEGGNGPARVLTDSRLYDLVQPGPHTIGLLQGLETGAYREVAYRISAATSATARHGSASRAQLHRM